MSRCGRSCKHNNGRQLPGLRPLTIPERHFTWIYGIAPSGLIYLLLVGITYLLVQPEDSLFRFYMNPARTRPGNGRPMAVNVQMILAGAST